MKKLLTMFAAFLVLTVTFVPATSAFESLIPFDKGECFRSMPWDNGSTRSDYITAPEHTVDVTHPVYYWKGGDIYGPISFYCAQAPAVEVVVLEPEVKKFVVYFDFDKSNIKNDQIFELERALTFINMFDSPVILNGYCDFNGPDDYNEALSARRNDAVKTWFEGRGVDTVRFDVTNNGERFALIRKGLGLGCADCWQDRKVEVEVSLENK